MEIIQNTISTRDLWNNGHEFSVAAACAVFLVRRLLPGQTHVEKVDILMVPPPPREMDCNSLTIYGDFLRRKKSATNSGGGTKHRQTQDKYGHHPPPG